MKQNSNPEIESGGKAKSQLKDLCSSRQNYKNNAISFLMRVSGFSRLFKQFGVSPTDLFSQRILDQFGV